MNARINLWRSYQYHDPADTLRRLRALELELGDLEIDPQLLSLRTNKLNKYRERRDAALFAHGLGSVMETTVFYAPEEAEDYDFVTLWEGNDEAHFCPVQLKELAPEHLNASASLSGLIASLNKYATSTDTVLAVKLNQKPELDLTTFRAPGVPFRSVYFFWATSPDSAHWMLYGDLKTEPGAFAYSYPD